MNALAPPIKAPWYRYTGVWLLILGPAVAVVFGLIMLAVAIKTEDSLVASDYYARGLAINRTLAREARATALHLSAQIEFRGDRLEVRLAGTPDATPITLKFVHASRASLDRSIELIPLGQGRFESTRAQLAPGHWGVILESPTWRLDGEFVAPSEEVAIRAQEAVNE